MNNRRRVVPARAITRRRWMLLAAMVGAAVATGVPSGARACPPAVAADLASVLSQIGAADLLLVGEQHDAPAHQAAQAALTTALACKGRLAALLLEMAEAGHSTRGLPVDANEAAVRAALGWNDDAWPWARYRAVVMAAVAAGVPVLGANLPRRAIRDAMRDAALDTAVPPAVLAQHRQAMDDGHCGLLPAAQLGPMARVQIARDRAMAATLDAERQPGRTVLLVAGAAHVWRDRGVPLHLAAPQHARVLWLQAGEALPLTGPDGRPLADLRLVTEAAPPVDHCAGLRRRMAPAR